MVLNNRGMITYGGRNLADFGVYISGNGTFNAPERDVKTVAIPGRNGDLTLDNGRFKNIKIKYPAFIVDDFFMNTEALRDFLSTFRGYARLEDSYHPEEYRMARISGSFTMKPEDKLRAGKFDLTFDCMPQRWLKSGEVKIDHSFASYSSEADSITVMNPTQQSAKPLIRLQSMAVAYININNIMMKITPTSATAMIIDCELQEAYNENTGASRNSELELSDGVFPTLDAGLNTVTLTGTGSGMMQASFMRITPRWWRL